MGVQDIYHRSPYSLRVAVASGRGAQLRRQRFDSSTDTLVDLAISREQWSDEQWRSFTDRRLQAILQRAARDVAAYRDVAPAVGVEASLGSFPLLGKSRLRANPASFVRDGAARGLVEEHTSGTTATPLRLYLTRAEYREWYALAEARWRRWYGVSRRDRWGIVGGQLVAPPRAASPPYWVWNAPMHQLYMSSYHISAASAAAYVEAIDRHRLRYLVGYPSAIYALALACVEQGIGPRPLRVVIGNAEPVLGYQRRMISEVFGCPVRETYGMAEYVAAASECEQGGVHLWPEVGVLEVVDHAHDRPAEPGAVGRFACTSLLNATMPLVRYLVGDAGALEPADVRCACGRNLPLLRSIEGRSDDLVHTRDGRLIGRLDPVFKEDLPISGAQIIQDDLDKFRVLVVPAAGYGDAAEASIRRRLIDRVGRATVTFETVDHLPTGANGKFKAVISHVTA